MLLLAAMLPPACMYPVKYLNVQSKASVYQRQDFERLSKATLGC